MQIKEDWTHFSLYCITSKQEVNVLYWQIESTEQEMYFFLQQVLPEVIQGQPHHIFLCAKYEKIQAEDLTLSNLTDASRCSVIEPNVSWFMIM